MNFQKDLINSMLHSWASTAYLMFDGRSAFRAVADGRIKGFKITHKVINPQTYETGAMFDILPDVNTETVSSMETWMKENPKLCEQFLEFYKPENAKSAADWANVLSQM